MAVVGLSAVLLGMETYRLVPPNCNPEFIFPVTHVGELVNVPVPPPPVASAAEVPVFSSSFQ